ncbi:MAG: hypothetical protein JWM81_318 [Candidatus Saccharibacteria bacterium]|nr:hypothetical protein [Candidatus Saccharibacteria bacterium]
MKKINFFQKASAALTVLAASLFLSTAVAGAIPYSGDSTPASPVPAFNVFTGVPSAGDESDFLRSRVPVNGDNQESTTPFTDPTSASCVEGQKIQMRVYVHNGASKDNNDNGNGASVAHGVNVKVAVNGAVPAKQFKPEATISADNAAAVKNQATINCTNSKNVTLSYDNGSAQQYAIGTGIIPVSDTIVTNGALITSEGKPGDVWGCWDERVYVVLTVTVHEITPPPVTPPAPVLQCVIDTKNFTVDNKNRKVSVGITATSTNATVTGYTIDWGDKTAVSTKQSDSHTYGSKIGSSVITASFTATYVDANGKTVTKTVSGADCVKNVSFTTTPPVTPPTTPTPVKPVAQTSLPATGAASTIGLLGLFAAASIVGTSMYRRFLTRD